LLKTLIDVQDFMSFALYLMGYITVGPTFYTKFRSISVASHTAKTKTYQRVNNILYCFVSGNNKLRVRAFLLSMQGR